MSDSENSSSGVQEADPDVQPYVDAADRLERTLDAQLQQIQDIDSRAGFITRLVAILLGVVVSVVSILVTLSTNGGGVVVLSPVTVFAGIVAALGLLGAMVMGIITYLSSRQVPGLGQPTANMLSDPDYETEMKEHLKSTLAGYEYALGVNGRIIEVNAARLQRTLTLLVIGVVYGTVTAASVVSDNSLVEVLLLVVVTLIMAAIVWYIHTKRYIVDKPEDEDTNERVN